MRNHAKNKQAKEGKDAEIEITVYDYLVNQHSKVDWFLSQKGNRYKLKNSQELLIRFGEAKDISKFTIRCKLFQS